MKDIKKAGLIIALVAAAVLLALPTPQTPHPALPPLTENDVVAPRILSEWILNGEEAYLLIDLRPEGAFLQDAIKTAISMPAATLDEATITSLPRHRRLIVYAANTEEAVQIWQRIKPYRERTYLLAGGMTAWTTQVLHPQEPAPYASQAAWNDYKQNLAAANFYLGKTDTAPVERERVVTPMLRPRPHVRNEGC